MTLTVARDELRALAAWLTSDGDAHYWLRALPTLRTELIINCFPAEVIDWTRRGRPRGQHAASPQTLRAARMALWLAELLIRLAIDDEALLARIAVLLDEPFGPAATTAERKRFSVGLMLRALRPVTLDSISISEGAAPARVISHLLGSRDSDRRARLERDLLSSPRDIREAILTAWETRLLGDQEGQVARDFGLLK